MIFDSNTTIKLTSVFPELAQAWKLVAIDMFDEHEVKIKVTEGLRTFSQQWDLWSQGRLKDKNGHWLICDIKKVVTYAMPGQSFHQYGLAIDTCFMGRDPYLSSIPIRDSELLWNEYGRLCHKHGLEWGGNWKRPDRPHAQWISGLTLHDLQILYEDGGIKKVWAECTKRSQCGRETK